MCSWESCSIAVMQVKDDTERKKTKNSYIKGALECVSVRVCVCQGTGPFQRDFLSWRDGSSLGVTLETVTTH